MDLVREANVKATFFVTHYSPVLHELRQEPERFELGLHPNFLKGSSHGDGERSVLCHCRDLVPEASAMRTHGLFQSTRLWSLIISEFPEIEADVSMFLPFHQNLRPTKLYVERGARSLTRLPFNWEDDFAAAWPGWDWAASFRPRSGLNVVNFHPIHVALNMANLREYLSLKVHLGDRPLPSATAQDIARFRSDEPGTLNFLRSVLHLHAPNAYATVSEIARLADCANMNDGTP